MGEVHEIAFLGPLLPGHNDRTRLKDLLAQSIKGDAGLQDVPTSTRAACRKDPTAKQHHLHVLLSQAGKTYTMLTAFQAL